MKYPTLVFLLYILGGCQQNSAPDALHYNNPMAAEAYEEVLSLPVTQQPPPPVNASQISNPVAAVEKKIIKNGRLTYKTADTQQSYYSILTELKKQEAYIESESQKTEYDRKNIRLTVRVESGKFDSLFSSLTKQSVDIEERMVSIEDVTERYFDLQARIKNRKALEARYTELLKKAESIKDMLEIEKSLNKLRTEIEIEEGRFRYLGKQVRYSTIQLNFYELLPYTYSSELRPGFGARLTKSLSSGWQGFLSFLVGLIGLWPFLLLLIILIFGFVKWRRKKVVPGK